MSAIYRKMWDGIFFLTNTAESIIEERLKIKAGTKGMLKRYEKNMPEENDMAQYNMGLFTPPILLLDSVIEEWAGFNLCRSCLLCGQITFLRYL